MRQGRNTNGEELHHSSRNLSSLLTEVGVEIGQEWLSTWSEAVRAFRSCGALEGTPALFLFLELGVEGMGCEGGR